MYVKVFEEIYFDSDKGTTGILLYRNKCMSKYCYKYDNYIKKTKLKMFRNH